MSQLIIYELAAFSLPGDWRALVALQGRADQLRRGVAVRRWQALAVGTPTQVLQAACRLAAALERGDLLYKPKKDILAEDFIGCVRKKLGKAAALGQTYDSLSAPRITGFCLRVEQDALATWRAQEPDKAQQFLALQPALRSPRDKLVLEKSLPATAGGFARWQACTGPQPFLEGIVCLTGAGEI